MALQTRVHADDGTPLHVEVDAVPSAPLSVVFVHGFTASLGEFVLQREALQGRATCVLYDCRGHGRSRSGRLRGATLDQLGRDLGSVLDQAVPPGPVVLFAHSMGGMTVMSLARQRPELFGSRVTGVFLLATSSGRLADRGRLGQLVRALRRLHLLALVLLLNRLWAPLLERLRVRGTGAYRSYVRRTLFGDDDADPQLVREVADLLEQTPLPVIAAYYPSLLAHDEHASLEVLHPLPVTLLVGSADRITPLDHSQRMAEALPDAELVVVPGAGHSVHVTRPQVVDAALLRLLERADPARAA